MLSIQRKPRPHTGGSRSAIRSRLRRDGTIAKLLLAILILLGVITGVVLAWQGKLLSRTEETPDLSTEVVKRGPLEITITERGSLESSNNKTLVCEVEGEAGTGILKIVEEGTRVKEGDELVVLDSSRLANDEAAQEIVVVLAVAMLKTAETNIEIQKTQNDSDTSAASLKWKLAQLDLKKYEQGDFVHERYTIQSEIALATEDLGRAQERQAFTLGMKKKGYAISSEVEADRIAVVRAKVNLNIAEGKQRVLNEFTHERTMEELKANAIELEREMERVKLRSAGALAKLEADHSAAELKYEVEKTKLAKIKRQLELCRIVAPRDGIVVYVNSRPGGGGRGSDLIFEGAKVRERQPIINLPDLSNMQVSARIHESKIAMMREGLSATIHVDARAGEQFHGEVSMVSLVPQSGNWPNINLKEYVTSVKLIDDPEKIDALRPGLTAAVEILIDRLSDVLQAPLQSFVERGGRHFAWVLDGNRPVRREVKLGKSNDRVTEILTGLEEGERLIQTPRTVLPKEVAQLQADVPAKVESPKPVLKVLELPRPE